MATNEKMSVLQLGSLLVGCLKRLEEHHSGRPTWSTDKVNRWLGWAELERIIEDADSVRGPNRPEIMRQFRWSGSRHSFMDEGEHIAFIAPKINDIYYRANNAERLKYALRQSIPVMSRLAIWAYINIARDLWVATLSINGISRSAMILERDMNARDEMRHDEMGLG